jgi:hypothetical protein
MRRNKRAQAWYMDFMIAIVIFSIAMITYFVYLPNISNQELTDLNDVYLDARIAVNSLMTPGLPVDWDNSSIIKIGLVDEGYDLNKNKVGRFKNIAYNRAKNLLGIRSEFAVFFINNKGRLMNIEGSYYIGHDGIDYSTNKDNITLAYYYKEKLTDDLYTAFDGNIFDIDVDVYNMSVADGLNSIDNYDLVIMEAPDLNTGVYPSQIDKVEEYVGTGGTLFIANEMASTGTYLLGIRHDDESINNQNATVNALNQYLNLSTGNILNCSEDYNVIEFSGTGNYNTTNYQTIAEFDESENDAIARWNYGNGTVYYFCDFESYVNNGSDFSEFIDKIDEATETYTQYNFFNGSISIDNIEANNLVRISRIINFKGRPIIMEVYIWDT